MRTLSELAVAGARRAEARRPAAARAGEGGPGGKEGAPAARLPELSRERLLRLVEGVAPRLGVPDKALRALRLIAAACPWRDFAGAGADPVCFRQQRRLAAELGVSPGHFRKLEARLEAVGLIERRTCENGYRGRLGPRGGLGGDPAGDPGGGAEGRPGGGGSGVVAGLSLGPLIAARGRLEALAEAMAAERRALEEARARVRVERRAARRAVEGLGDGHPARAGYLALRGARFPDLGRCRDVGEIEAHWAALRAVTVAGRRAQAEAEAAAREETSTPASEARGAASKPGRGPAPGAGANVPCGHGFSGLDRAIWSGGARRTERRHTEETTETPIEDCSGAATDEATGAGARGGPTAAQAETGGPGRERDQATTAAPGEPEGGAETTAEGRGEGEEAEEGARIGPRRALSAKVRGRLSPAMLRAMASEEMRFYLDHLEPGGGWRREGGGPAGEATDRGFLGVLEAAGRLRREELGIAASAWDEAERALGWLGALVALVVVDANRAHPTAPVRNPGGLLRDLARRQRAGTLDLGASVMALWRRAEGA